MPPFPMIDPSRFLLELVYFLSVIIMCLIISQKTGKMVSLTGHRGIMYFRNAFFFFALAYIFRFISLIDMILHMQSTFIISNFAFRGIMFATGYLSSMAILSLTMSTMWGKINVKHINLWLNIIAISIPAYLLISKSLEILIYFQVGLLIFSAITSYKNHTQLNEKTKFSSLYTTYALLAVFWILNLSTILHIRNSMNFIDFKLQSIIYLISIILFYIILKKVIKCTNPK